jgi:hypothetical protein
MEEERVIQGKMINAIIELTLLIIHSRERQRRRRQ